MNENGKFALFLLGIIAAIFLFGSLKILAPIAVPMAIAAFLAAMLVPIIDFLGKYIPKVAVIPVILLFTVVGILIDVSLLYIGVRELGSKAPIYGQKIQDLSEKLIDIAAQYDVQLDLSQIQLKELFSWAVNFTVSSLSSIFSLLGTTFLIVFILIFLLSELNIFQKKLEQAFDDQLGERVLNAFRSISKKIQRYALTKTIISMITGLSVFLFTWFMKIDFAIFWGVLAFYLNFIPNIGSIIAVIPPILISYLQYGSFQVALITFVGLTSIQITFGNIIEPRVMGKGLQLSPLVVFLSLIFWGWLWGIAGMFLSIPLTVGLKIVFSHIEPLRPVAVLLGDLSSLEESESSEQEGNKTSENADEKREEK